LPRLADAGRALTCLAATGRAAALAVPCARYRPAEPWP